MSTDIRASLALTTLATQAARSDSGAQNQVLDIGSDAGFPRILEQQANARTDARSAPADDSSRIKEREEAGQSQAGGKRLPAGPDRAGERRAEARRTERADARERANADASRDAAASRDADVCRDAAALRDAESARRSADDVEEKAASAEEKNTAGDGNGAGAAPPVDPAAALPAAILPAIPLAAGSTDAVAQDGESAAQSDAVVQELSLSVESAVLPVADGAIASSAEAPEPGIVAESAATAQAAVDAGLLLAAGASLDGAALAGMDTATAAATDAEADLALAVAASTLSAAATVPAAEVSASQPATAAGPAEQSALAAASRPVSVPESIQRTGNDAMQSAVSAQSGELSAMESDALSAEAGLGDKSAGNSGGSGADTDKGSRATPERVVAFREQLAVLAQQVDAGNRAAASVSTKKSDSIQDGKGFALTRNMEQLSAARADTGKAASTGIQTLLTNREWAGEVGQRLLMMVSSKIKSAEIHLNPKELGPMEVRIRMHEDKAHVVFTSQVAQTREALEQAVPRLREMLDQNGVTLGNVNVQDHGAQHSHQRQQPDQHAGGDVRGRQVADDTDVAPVIRRDLSLVDFYA